MKTYRIALMRAYTVLQEYDVLAATPDQAQNMAAEAAQARRPDPRAEAIDKGWLPVGSTGIREIGAGKGPTAYTVPTQEVPDCPGVFERGE